MELTAANAQKYPKTSVVALGIAMIKGSTPVCAG